MAHSDGSDDAPPPSADSQVTARERDVLAASATGLTTAEVAGTLNLTPEAVRGALASAIMRLGARSKLEAIVVAFRRGLIEVP